MSGVAENAAQILGLFRECFGRELSEAFWRWRFAENPFDAPLIELEWDGDRLAAHYAACPTVLCVDGKDRMGALSMTTMTHPAYRGRGLFPLLAGRLYDRLEKKGYFAVYGFPNAASHRIFMDRLGWRDILEVPMLQIRAADAAQGPRGGGETGELQFSDPRIDLLWGMVPKAGRIMVKRDSRYFAWRYGSNPVNTYKAIGFDENGRLLGMLVYKRHTEHSVDLVELVTADDERVALALLRHLAGRCAASGVEVINAWASLHSWNYRVMERAGFVHAAPVTFMGGRALLKQSGPDPSDCGSWRFSMGDSDIF